MNPTATRRAALSAVPILAVALIACTAPDRQSGSNQPQRSSAGMMAGEMPMMGMQGGMMQGGMMQGGMMQGGMMQGGMMGGMEDMRSIHGLLADHESIERTVEDLPNGVRTVTTSKDPRVAELIRTHVRQMRDRYKNDQPIRAMDPLFRELFERRDEATLEIKNIPGGVEVLHTSPNAEVVKLIRQHARHFVNGVVERGMAGAMGPTPLPEGYPGR